MRSEDIIHNAERMYLLLQDPLLIAVFQAVEEETISAWRFERDPAKREELWHQIQALGLIHSRMVGYVERGKLLKNELEMREING